MSAVLGTDAELIEKICNETQGIVSIANYNCPGQIVITGEETAVICHFYMIKPLRLCFSDNP